MEFPGVSASPEALEAWLDATTDRRINCARQESRWRRVPAASPTERSLHECINCGRLSSSAEKACYPLVGDKGKWR